MKLIARKQMHRTSKDESGIAHLGLILLLVGILSVVAVGYWRVNTSKKTQGRSTSSLQSGEAEALPQDLQNIKTLEEVSQIAGATDGTSIIKFVLESKDGKYIYKIVLSSGKKLVIDASTGHILSEETTDVSEDDKLPAGVQITLSLADVYKLAASKSSSPIKTIEMEVEDKKVVYKVEYKDGSKIEIDASSGAIVKSEIKDESEEDEEDEHEDEDHDDEEDEEDHENEDSDDSQDSEDHEEEDR